MTSPPIRYTAAGVARLATDVVVWAMSQLPFNAQSAQEEAAAELFLAKQLHAKLIKRADKFEDQLKAGIRAGTVPVVNRFGDYQITGTIGTSRQSFDKDAFIMAVAETFDLPKHALIELAGKCMRDYQAPVTITVEYVPKGE